MQAWSMTYADQFVLATAALITVVLAAVWGARP
jgi:hypothetical protein